MRNKLREYLKLSNFYKLIDMQLDNLFKSSSILKLKSNRNFNIEELELLIMPLYAKLFTEEELDEIIEYLKSPIGKKMLEVNNSISADINLISNKWIKDNYDKSIKEA